MADLVAVHNGLALFRSGDLGVIVDTEDLNPFDPQPYNRVFSQLPWESADPADANPVWKELAESSFAISSTPEARAVVAAGNIARVVRVPKNVQQSATKALTRPGLTATAQAVARSLASGSVSAATVMRMRNYFGTHSITASGASEFMAHGGRAGQAWSDKTGRSLLAAAGEDDSLPPSDFDPDAPHMFAPDAVNPAVCAVCGLPEEDPRHVVSESEDELAGTKYYGLIENDDTTNFTISGLFALDENGSWWERHFGEWEPAQAPDEMSLLELDDNSFVSLQRQIDDPEVELAELSVSEARLYELAAPELARQGEALDALFAAVPYVDPAVRSENAKKQVRDADGKFIKMGARIKTDAGITGTVKDTNEDGTVNVETDSGVQVVDAGAVHRDEELPQESGTPVARLPQPLELVTDVAGRIKSYIESQKGKDDAVTAAGEAPVADPTPVEDAPAEAPATGTPGGTDVEPLHLAIVDDEDTQAVLDLIAIIPGDPATGASLEAYRRAEGAWEPAADMLQRLQGTTPPPVVELDAANLADVIQQIDAGTESAPAEEPAPAEPAPVAAAGLRRFELTESGALVASIVEGPALLAPYEEYPEDVVARIAEFATPESSDVDSPAANRLKRYWEHGEGAAKIRWGTDGDWTRCVRQLSKYMGPRAKGYCTLRHKGALGYYPGELDRPGNPKSGDRKGAFGVDVSPDLEEFSAKFADNDTEADPTVADPEAPHEPVGDDPAEPCALCGRSWDDPIHTEFAGAAGETAIASDPVPAEPIDIHEFVPSEIDPNVCAICGEGPENELHGEAAPSPANVDTFNHNTVDPETGLPPEEPDWSEPHVFEEDEETMTDEPKCVCGQDPDAPIHIVVAPMPEEAVEEEGDEELVDEETGIVIVASAGVGGGARFRIPVVVPEGKESGDGRVFAADSLTSRDVPLALMWQIQSDEGHKQSVIVGRVDHVERLPEGGLGNAYGVFDDGEYGQEALRLVRGGMLRGISADLDEFEADVIEPAAENKIMSPKIEVQKGRLMGVTLVAKPAFAECTIELVDGEDDEVADGEYEEQTPMTVAASIVASAAPVEPPKSWFENPKLSKPTPLTIDDDGRVFGHIATWETSHIGLPYGTRPPRSVTNYQYFRTGVIRTAEGDDVPVGQLTLAGGHAPLQADANAAVKHYDDTASAWADVAAGEDKHGIWVSGAVRPDITAAQIRVARASAPSGDWRPINGTLELVAACCVNVPGFPVARAMVAGGQITALVAAGTADLVMEKTFQDPTFKSMRDNLDALGRLVSSDKGEQARAKLDAARAARHEALVASAKARVDAVRQEREQALQMQADEVRERMQALLARGGPVGYKVKREFDESKHPRDTKGRFRKVLARLMDSLDGERDRDQSRALTQAKDALKSASDFEQAGDDEAAKIAGEEAKAALEKAKDEVSDEVKRAVIRAAEDVGEALARLAKDPDKDEGLAFADLPEEVKELLKAFVDRIEQTADPLNVEQADNKIKAWVAGKGFRSPEEIAAMIASFLKEKVKPNPITKGGPFSF